MQYIEEVSSGQVEESYYLNPKVESFLKKMKSDTSQREVLINNLELKIEDPVAIKQGNILALQAFRLITKYQAEAFTTVSRRFNDFLWLEKILCYDYLGRIIPLNPPKNFLTKFQLISVEFMQQRIKGVTRFANRILELNEINISDHVYYFFFASRKEFALHQQEASKNIVDIYNDGMFMKATKIASFAFSFLKFVTLSNQTGQSRPWIL